MSLKKIVDRSTTTMLDAITDRKLSAKEMQKLRAVIESAVIQAVEQTRIAHEEATIVCCGPEADLAHKIETEAKQKTRMLIANLNALR